MTPETEALVRASLAIRSIKATYALFRSVQNPPTQVQVEAIAASMNRPQFSKFKSSDSPARLEAMDADKHAKQQSCNALLKAQLRARQVPSWPAMVEYWQRHGRPSCADVLAA